VRVTVIGTGFDHRPGRSVREDRRREGERGGERRERRLRSESDSISSLEISDEEIDVPPFLR
jgi:cell division protein FtsZ